MNLTLRLLHLPRALAGLAFCGAPFATAADELKFQFVTGAISKELVEELQSRLAARAAAPPAERVPPVVWTCRDGKYWMEQDSLLRQREFVFSDDFIENGTKAGIIVRLRTDGGKRGMEMLLPLPGAPGGVRQRTFDEDKGNSAWTPVPDGLPEWIVPAPPAVEYKGGETVWKNSTGNASFRGTLAGASLSNAVFTQAGGGKKVVALNRLGLRESIIVRRWIEEHDFTPPLPPHSIGVSLNEAAGNKRVAKERGDRGEYRDMHAYSTPHYDFWSTDDMSGANLQTVGMSFEATWKLLGALEWSHPWPMPPEGKNKVRIFKTDNAYHMNGGPEGTAGVFQLANREFLVPFSSLALGGKVESTLHHEGAHQCMQELLPCLPLWVAEGTAEYVGSLDFKKGHFQLPMGAARLRDVIDLGADLKPGQALRVHRFVHSPVNEVLKAPYWPVSANTGGLLAVPATALRYRTSLLLVFYFLELERDRTKFLRFLSAARRLRDEIKLHPNNRRVLYNHYLVEAYNNRVAQWNALVSANSGRPGAKSYEEMLSLRPPVRTEYLHIDAKPGGDLNLIAGDNTGLLLKWEPPTMVPLTAGRDGVVRTETIKVASAMGGVQSRDDPRNQSGFATLIRRWQEKYLGIGPGFEDRFYKAFEACKSTGLDLRAGRE